MLDETIVVYAIVDDLLKAIGHREDIRCLMSDAEIITTALIAAMFFNGNHKQACEYMRGHKFISRMLEKSRFNRRLHRLSMLINDLFHHIVMHIDIINEQVWIQANNTDRLTAEDLVQAGIPPEAIVLGLQPPEIRPYTAYGTPLSHQHSQLPRKTGGYNQEIQEPITHQ